MKVFIQLAIIVIVIVAVLTAAFKILGDGLGFALVALFIIGVAMGLGIGGPR